MSLLYITDEKRWFNIILAYPNWQVHSKEKVLALALPEIMDWFGEQAKEDEDMWGARVRYAPSLITRKSGLSRSTVWRILKLWNEHGIVSIKSEHYTDQQNQFHSRCYMELLDNFYNALLDVGRVLPEKKARGVKKGTTFQQCPHCGKAIRRKLVCDSGHVFSVNHKYLHVVKEIPGADDLPDFFEDVE